MALKTQVKAAVSKVAATIKTGINYKLPVPAPLRKSINTGLSAAKVSTLEKCFGDFTGLPTDCGKVKNKKVAQLLETRNVGPFRVTGIKPALDDLEEIFAEVKKYHPELYAMLGTAGMTCYRCVRDYPGVPSNHAAGTAIDMTIAGTLTLFNAKVMPRGLVILYGYFHRKGWYWAAGYKKRTDPMHFEVSNERLLQWDREGKI